MDLALSVFTSIQNIPQIEWDACAGEGPFVQYAFLKSLETSQAPKAKGIKQYYFLIKTKHGQTVACIPAMLKWGTKREFGPEFKWLYRGLKNNSFSWPKLQLGIPLFPTAGPKLLIREGFNTQAIRTALIENLLKLATHKFNINAFNLMHCYPKQLTSLEKRGWLISYEYSSVWRNQNYASFDSYIAQLPSRKRRLYRQEQKNILQTKLSIQVLSGPYIPKEFWQNFYAGYLRVCTEHGNEPWLPEQFFSLLSETMPESIRVFAAFDGNRFVAGSFCLLSSTALYVQIWSALNPLPDLCFDLLCYQPIKYAIEQKLDYIDAGVAGEHKRCRGFNNEAIANAHWIKHPELKQTAIQVLQRMEQQTA